MEEDLKILEEIKNMFIHLRSYGWINDIKRDIDTDKAIQAIENTESRLKQLEEENRILKRANSIAEDISIEDITQVMNKAYEDFMKDFIPTSLVKEKIEKINKAYEDSKDGNGESEYYYPDYTIRVLEELLEEGK